LRALETISYWLCKFFAVYNQLIFHRWDARDDPNQPIASIEAHPAPINCIHFHPFDEVYCVTGSSDHVRNPSFVVDFLDGSFVGRAKSENEAPLF
jgi:WD40 repeat protein